MLESGYIEANDQSVRQAANIPLLGALPLDNVRQVLSHCRTRTFEPGEDITRAGEVDHWMYIMLSGKVEVLEAGMRLNVLQRFGDAFGEMGVIDRTPRRVTVRAMRRTICLAVDTSLLERLPDSEQVVFHALFYRVLAEKLSDQVRTMDAELAQATELLGRYQERHGTLEPAAPRRGRRTCAKATT